MGCNNSSGNDINKPNEDAVDVSSLSGTDFDCVGGVARRNMLNCKGRNLGQ